MSSHRLAAAIIRSRALWSKGLCALSLVLLPALGALAAKLPMAYLLEFPPITQFVRHRDFSWAWWFCFAVLIAASLSPFAARFFETGRRALQFPEKIGRFPLIGSGGLILTAVFWVIAWSRFEPLRWLQPHTFFPLWLGFTIFVNGIADAVGGSPLKAQPKRYFFLFVLSSGFWWYFEYLNRFVQNWSYQNVSQFSPFEYFIFATLSFSTVLPAAAAAGSVLFRLKIGDAFLFFLPVPWIIRPAALGCIALTSAAALLLVPVFPNALFPFVWLAPAALVLAALELCPGGCFLSQVARGDWSRVVVWALSALVCGFFWEMWNWLSFARWAYHVPLVSHFYVFEMPALGFAGYLPFGVLCGALIEQVLRFNSKQ